MLKEKEKIITIIAGIIILITQQSLASTLKKIEINNSSSQAKISLSFDYIPENTIQNNEEGIIIFLKNTKTDIISWPNNIKEGIISGIELNSIGNDIAINLKTTIKNISFKENNNKNQIILNIIKQDIKQPKQDLPFKLPPSQKNIELPSTEKTYHGKRISIDVQEADLQNILRLLAKIGKFNLVLSDDVQGKITLSLKNVPWDQVLDIILASKNLGMIKNGNVIRIAPLTSLQKETEQLAKIKEALSKEENVAPLKTVYLQVNYAKAEDIVKQIQALLTERGSVTFDERTNKIILKDVPSVIEKAKELITKLDEPVKQVLIEAKIVEINSNFEHRLGIKWSGAAWKITNNSLIGVSPKTKLLPAGNNVPGGTTPTVGVVMPGTNIENETDEYNQQGYQTLGDVIIPSAAIVDLGVEGTTNLGLTLGKISTHSALLLDVQLSAMEEEGIAKIISSPKIITMDHLEAEIKQGYKIPYLKQTQDGISTEFLDAGLTLKVIPHVTPDNRITLEIDTEKSAPDWSNTVNGVPTIVTRAAKSKVLVENGETIVIGGIKTEDLTESHGKVPGLGDLPGVGKLFKNKEYQNNKAELLIFITARVVTADVKDVDY